MFTNLVVSGVSGEFCQNSSTYSISAVKSVARTMQSGAVDAYPGSRQYEGQHGLGMAAKAKVKSYSQ